MNQDMKKWQETINQIKAALATPEHLTPKDNERFLEAVTPIITALDNGQIRVCNRKDTWITHTFIKEAILLYFRFRSIEEQQVGPFVYTDKIPLKTNFKALKVRVVPPATARFGSFMEPNVILMPSYVNIGAYIGEGTMVDTWATVGSCAQIGKHVHLSGGVGIGGVLEPAQATPVIIEDHAFLGSRAIVVEGVHVKKEAVLAANVVLTQSTPIIDTRTGLEIKGFVPERAVVVPGTRKKQTEYGDIQLACAYIIGERKPSTDLKVSLNDALRDYGLAV